MVVVAVVLAAVAVAAVVVAVVARRALAAAERQRDSLADELGSARQDAASAAARADDAERVLDAARRELTAGEALVQSLWSLELLRVAREWAVTGGPLPDGVAVDVGAELAMALRMELDRLREETGIPGELDPATDLDAPIPTATALTALRLVEEVVAVTSRPSDGFSVRAVVDDDRAAVVVTIALDAADADVPAVLRAVVATAGASLAVDGPVVTLRVPVPAR